MIYTRPVYGIQDELLPSEYLCHNCDKTFHFGVMYKFWKGSEERGYCLDCLAKKFDL